MNGILIVLMLPLLLKQAIHGKGYHRLQRWDSIESRSGLVIFSFIFDNWTSLSKIYVFQTSGEDKRQVLIQIIVE